MLEEDSEVFPLALKRTLDETPIDKPFKAFETRRACNRKPKKEFKLAA